MSVHFSSILVWTILGSLTFGFCSIWSLHFVAMLACELDLPIGINVPLTLLSSVLAVLFTFAALASDLLWDKYIRWRNGKGQSLRRRRARPSAIARDSSSKPLLDNVEQEDEDYSQSTGDSGEPPSHIGLLQSLPLEMDENVPSNDDGELVSPPISIQPELNGDPTNRSTALPPTPAQSPEPSAETIFPDGADSILTSPDSLRRISSDHSVSRRSPSLIGSTHSSYKIGSIMNIAYRSTSPAKNAFIATGEALYAGCTWRNVIKGFLWSLAITSMHYVGIAALIIPTGYFTLDPSLVVLSSLISWVVCVIGCILISQMETHLTQQFLFSIVASTGVAAMVCAFRTRFLLISTPNRVITHAAGASSKHTIPFKLRLKKEKLTPKTNTALHWHVGRDILVLCNTLRSKRISPGTSCCYRQYCYHNMHCS